MTRPMLVDIRVRFNDLPLCHKAARVWTASLLVAASFVPEDDGHSYWDISWVRVVSLRSGIVPDFRYIEASRLSDQARERLDLLVNDREDGAINTALMRDRVEDGILV